MLDGEQWSQLLLSFVEAARDFAGGQAVRFVLDHEAKGRKPGGLGQGRERVYSCCIIHISGYIDIL